MKQFFLQHFTCLLFILHTTAITPMDTSNLNKITDTDDDFDWQSEQSDYSDYSDFDDLASQLTDTTIVSDQIATHSLELEESQPGNSVMWTPGITALINNQQLPITSLACIKNNNTPKIAAPVIQSSDNVVHKTIRKRPRNNQLVDNQAPQHRYGKYRPTSNTLSCEEAKSGGISQPEEPFIYTQAILDFIRKKPLEIDYIEEIDTSRKSNKIENMRPISSLGIVKSKISDSNQKHNDTPVVVTPTAPIQARTPDQYTKAFKLKAIKKVLLKNNLKDVAKNLNIPIDTLRYWVNQQKK